MQYAKYIRRLIEHAGSAPIILWNDYQPRIYDAINPRVVERMRRDILPFFDGKSGICIGGSLRWLFKEYMERAARVVYVDIVANYPGSRAPNYLTHASNLDFARDGEFDFVCSSHVLEHLANPVLALKEWMRVLRVSGVVYCAVPDKRFTFDHKRKRTTIQHLVKDYEKDVGLQDLSHLYDFFLNFDFGLAQVERQVILRQVLDYYSATKTGSNAFYQPHHHVLVKDDLIALFKYAGLEILLTALRGETVHMVGEKLP